MISNDVDDVDGNQGEGKERQILFRDDLFISPSSSSSSYSSSPLSTFFS